MLYPGSDLNSALLGVLGDLAYWYYEYFFFKICLNINMIKIMKGLCLEK
jgi:hypothetical protein